MIAPSCVFIKVMRQRKRGVLKQEKGMLETNITLFQIFPSHGYITIF